jgi:hypothetical protein
MLPALITDICGLNGRGGSGLRGLVFPENEKSQRSCQQEDDN